MDDPFPSPPNLDRDVAQALVDWMDGQFPVGHVAELPLPDSAVLKGHHRLETVEELDVSLGKREVPLGQVAKSGDCLRVLVTHDDRVRGPVRRRHDGPAAPAR